DTQAAGYRSHATRHRPARSQSAPAARLLEPTEQIICSYHHLLRPTTFWRKTRRSCVTAASCSPSYHLRTQAL
ncbi:hypothetical protein AX14_014490, partial [Amanita brunnescens Koide BX004]